MEITFLGTGGGIPSKDRNVASLALRWTERRGRTWLFDCGEGTQHQILRSPVRLPRVDRVFITHLHGDHIFGLPGLLGSRSFQGAESSLFIHAPEGLRPFVEASLKASATHLRYSLEWRELTEGKWTTEEGVRVEVAKLSHSVPSYGFRIEEPDQPGCLDVSKLQAEGISPGPVYRDLKRGETVRLPDGRILYGEQYRRPDRPGRVIAILGDTRPTEEAVRLARGADLLIHEATFRKGREDLAAKHGHTTSVQAAQIAVRAGVGGLLLTHISPRYSNAEAAELEEEARKQFPNTDVVVDGQTVTVVPAGG
ncbi:ribonuclease Z [Desmospora profundinema]|uniref:Ribonuclease Z n=1 Tax=Desmospora profundinema TaxID=1571184 RepID=A0ABU1ILV3_9BACL|nr:ribonuclease Z [Desmospora profundinema]MDR6225766.1 ribonuclease Z [Desmospora profundinema]